MSLGSRKEIMKTVYSALENNIFSGVLLKKGKNIISDRAYNTLLLNVDFCTFIGLGYIKVKGADFTKVKQTVTESVTPDFDSMTYAQLKKHVTDNCIEVKSMKKADILEVLKGE